MTTYYLINDNGRRIAPVSGFRQRWLAVASAYALASRDVCTLHVADDAGNHVHTTSVGLRTVTVSPGIDKRIR